MRGAEPTVFGLSMMVWTPPKPSPQQQGPIGNLLARNRDRDTGLVAATQGNTSNPASNPASKLMSNPASNPGEVTSTVTHWGPFLVRSDGERITAVEDHPLDPDPSPIGQGLKAATELRVAKPAIRKSWLDGGPDTATDRRGNEPFVEVEWDEALDLVAAELTRVKEHHGNESIYGGSYGWGSAGRFHQPSNQIYRFLRQFGGYTDARGTYSGSAAETIVPHVLGMGYNAAVGKQTSWSVIAEHTELFVSFGSLRLSNAQVTFGGSGPHHTKEWLEKCGHVRFMSVSPLADDDASFVDSRWVPIRPSTDTALMAGLIHTLIDSDAADEAFLQRYCHGWEELKAYLLGTADGQPKDAAWAGAITGIDPAAIRAMAQEMATSRTMISVSLSIQRTDHGEQPYWMAIALAAALGGIGLPGQGVAFGFGANGNTGAGQVRKRIPGISVPMLPAEMPVISVSRITELLERAPGPHHFNGSARELPDIRLIYWVGGNPFHHHQDLNRLQAAWRKPETIIVHEPFWNPMSKRADIVLPATTPLERNDLGGAETLLIAMQAAIEPQGEARDDFAIFAALADRLGFGDKHHEGRSADEWVRSLYDRFAEANEYAPSFDEFWSDGLVAHADMAPMGMREQVFLAEFRADPTGDALGTPSGKIELFSDVIAAFGYDDCPPHPTWMEPYERLGTTAAERHPLHLVSNQPRTRLHSQYDHAEVSLATKVAGREPARLHPDEAAARGIADGDIIRVFNDRGACLAGAIISDRVAPGMLQLATGAWYDPDEDGMCKHGNPNVLTRDKGTSKLAQGPSAHTCLVEVERFDGEPPPVTAFDLPQFVSRSSAG
jgi:biotin/methionine sulfoxide reductase